MSNHHIVNDVTHLNPVRVMAIVAPTCMEEVQEAMRRTTGPVSIGGGRFSMGGQTASPGSLHFDMRTMNRVVWFSPERQDDPRAGGGALVRHPAVRRPARPGGEDHADLRQLHRRRLAQRQLPRPLRRAWAAGAARCAASRSCWHDGSVVTASRDAAIADLFYGAIGGYGGLGVIVEAELDLAENTRVERDARGDAAGRLPRALPQHGAQQPEGGVPQRRPLPAALRRPCARSTWVETEERGDRRRPGCSRSAASYPLHQYFLLGDLRDAVRQVAARAADRPAAVPAASQVHWRNYEAGYDVAELEPPSRDAPHLRAAGVLRAGRAASRTSCRGWRTSCAGTGSTRSTSRSAMRCPTPARCWPGRRRETFAFVLYYKQRTRAERARARVGVWTRELIDAGARGAAARYYLPYQPHGDARAVPPRLSARAGVLRAEVGARSELPLHQRALGQVLPRLARSSQPEAAIEHPSEFHRVFGDVGLSDAFYRFLQTVFRTVPEDRFHHLIADACKRHRDEEAVYRYVQQELKGIKPFLSELTLRGAVAVQAEAGNGGADPAVLGSRRRFEGYVEIGSQGPLLRQPGEGARPGRSLSFRRRAAARLLAGRHPRARRHRASSGMHVPLDDYAPIAATAIGDGSVDLVACYVGLHHMTAERLEPFLASVGADAAPGRRVHRPRPRRRLATRCGRWCRSRTRCSTPAWA